MHQEDKSVTSRIAPKAYGTEGLKMETEMKTVPVILFGLSLALCCSTASLQIIVGGTISGGTLCNGVLVDENCTGAYNCFQYEYVDDNPFECDRYTDFPMVSGYNCDEEVDEEDNPCDYDKDYYDYGPNHCVDAPCPLM